MSTLVALWKKVYYDVVTKGFLNYIKEYFSLCGRCHAAQSIVYPLVYQQQDAFCQRDQTTIGIHRNVEDRDLN